MKKDVTSHTLFFTALFAMCASPQQNMTGLCWSRHCACTSYSVAHPDILVAWHLTCFRKQSEARLSSSIQCVLSAAACNGSLQWQPAKCDMARVLFTVWGWCWPHTWSRQLLSLLCCLVDTLLLYANRVGAGAVMATLHCLGISKHRAPPLHPPCRPLPAATKLVCVLPNTPHWLKSVFKLPSKKPTDKEKPRQIDRMLEQLKK